MSETVWARAKGEIQRRGWYQGDFSPDGSPEAQDHCPVCLAGAINYVLSGDPWGEGAPVVDQLAKHLIDEHMGSEGASGSYGLIGRWNDAPERTVDEVYALLDELDAAERGAS